MKKYKLHLLFLVIGLLIGLLITNFNPKENHVLLTDGDNAILSFDNDIISANEYYNALKNMSGIEILLDLIDTKLLASYVLSEDEKALIEKEMNETINQYTKYYNTTVEEFLISAGFKSQDELLNYLILEQQRALYEKAYLKDKITSQEINYYYINKMASDFEIMYFKSDNDTLTKVMVELKEGTSKEEIASKYHLELVNLGFIAFDNKEINADIYDDARKLSANSFTTSIRSINNEYYIIFKGKIKEKDSIENLKERIIQKIVDEKISNDTDKKLYKEALIHLRQQNHLVIADTYLNNLYTTYQKNN